MKLEFTTEQLAILSEAIVQLPFKVAAPLIQQINSQIQEAHKTKETNPNSHSIKSAYYL